MSSYSQSVLNSVRAQAWQQLSLRVRSGNRPEGGLCARAILQHYITLKYTISYYNIVYAILYYIICAGSVKAATRPSSRRAVSARLRVARRCSFFKVMFVCYCLYIACCLCLFVYVMFICFICFGFFGGQALLLPGQRRGHSEFSGAQKRGSDSPTPLHQETGSIAPSSWISPFHSWSPLS